MKQLTNKEQTVVEILAQLSEGQIEALIKRFHKGLTQKQAGEEMRISNERVRQLETGGLGIIRKIMKHG